MAEDPFAGVEVMEVFGSETAALLSAPTPSSITAFDAEDLIALGATDISGVSAATPNLEIRTQESTSAVFFIRGVGLNDFSSNATSSVAVYVDGVPMNSPVLQLGQLFDIQDFQVLKGPQSGAAGRNSSAGSILIRAREPGFSHTGNLSISVGSLVTEDAIDAMKVDVQGGIDIPLVEDVLAARLAFTVRSDDPFIRNRCAGAKPIAERGPTESVCGERRIFGDNRPPVPTGLESRIGEKVDWGARAVFKLIPPDVDASFVLNVHARQLRQDSTLGEPIGAGDDGTFFGGRTQLNFVPPEILAEQAALQARGLSIEESRRVLSRNLARNRPLDREPFTGNFNRVGQTRLDHYGVSLRSEFMLSDVTIKSISGFDYFDRSRNVDQDFTPNILFEALTEDNAFQFAQEIQVSGELDSLPLRWEAGGTYLIEDLNSRAYQSIESFIPNTRNFTRTFHQEIQSFGVYGLFSFDFLENFTLDAVARFNWEQKDFDIGDFGGGFDPEEVRVILDDEIRTWSAPTGSISLTYRLTENVRTFWKYSRGYKSGTFNANNARDLNHASPERVDAFEVGTNGRFWGDRLQLDAAFFSYAYQDLQVFVFRDEPGGNPPSLQIINADDARVIGVDTELTLEPLLAYAPEEIEQLSIKLRFGWLDTKFIRFTDLQNRVSTGGTVFQITDDSSGNPLINSPELKFSGTVEWKLLLGRLGSLIPRYDVTWSDDIFFDQTAGRGGLNGTGTRAKPKFTTGQPALWNHNIRLAFKNPEETIEIAGWCRNLTDERSKISAFDASAFAKVVINFVAEPRSCGAQLSLLW
jgi:iron complex outermembrane receptor protein